MTRFIKTRNTISGRVGLVPEHYLSHPVLGENLIEVDEDAKDAEPIMYKPKSAAEAKEAKAAKSKADDASDEKPLN